MQQAIKITDNYETNHKVNADKEKNLVKPYKIQDYYISGIVVTHDSKMMATMDSHCAVSLFKKDYRNFDPREPIEWNFCGKCKAHQIEITSVSFGESLDENE